MRKVHRSLATGRLPGILVVEEEFETLSDFSSALMGALPDVGQFLEEELNRAQLVPRNSFPVDVVAMNSTVEFQWKMDQRRETLRLVFPEHYVADGTKVSIASPVGVALLGMRVGETITWVSRRGEEISLTVLSTAACGQMA